MAKLSLGSWSVIALILIVLWTPTAAIAQTDQNFSSLRNLAWQRGPAEAAIGTKAAIEVPQGFVFLDAKDTQRFQELAHNISDGREYLLAPDDLGWYVLFEFSATGYIKDNEKIDANSILENIKRRSVIANKERRRRGWGTMTVTGWRFPPRYNRTTKRLEWAVLAQDDATHEPVVNYNTRILGRTGVMSVTLVAVPQGLDQDVRQLKAILGGFQYEAGERYSEFKPGDKVAKYGLAALITGGAAAVATKTGFFKWLAAAAIGLWKFILAGIAAFFAGIRALFKRNK